MLSKKLESTNSRIVEVYHSYFNNWSIYHLIIHTIYLFKLEKAIADSESIRVEDASKTAALNSTNLNSASVHAPLSSSAMDLASLTTALMQVTAQKAMGFSDQGSLVKYSYLQEQQVFVIIVIFAKKIIFFVILD